MIRIDRSAPRPIYLQVKDGLRKRIAEGRFDADRPLPSEQDLADQLRLNRLTVRRAFVELAEEGLIHRIRGRGSFLRQPRHGTKADLPAERPPRNLTFAVLCDTERLDPRDALFYYRIFQGVLRADPAVHVVYRRVDDPRRAFLARLKKEPQLHGLIVLSQVDPSLLKGLMSEGRPCAFVDCAPIARLVRADAITYETEESAFQAVSSLIRLGHRDIGMLIHAAFPVGRTSTVTATPLAQSKARVNAAAAQRLQGYRRAFREHGLHVPENLVLPVIPLADAGYAATRRLLRGRRVPTALFTSTDTVAVGAVAAVKDHGWRVPAQMSVIGVGDLGHFCTPALSTIRMPLESVGETAVRLLKERLAQPDREPRQLTVPTEYIARATCDVPRDGTGPRPRDRGKA